MQTVARRRDGSGIVVQSVLRSLIPIARRELQGDTLVLGFLDEISKLVRKLRIEISRAQPRQVILAGFRLGIR